MIAQGINAGDVKKLQDAGIYTVNGVMMHTKKVIPKISLSQSSIHSIPLRFPQIFSNLSQSLTSIKGLSEAKVEKICEAAEKLVVSAFTFSSSFSNTPRFNSRQNEPFKFQKSFPQNVGYVTGSDLLIKV